MDTKKIVIIGAPNVGKSSLFNNFSGIYATVSNYPGTTVEILRTEIAISRQRYEIIDTPGIYSLLPLSEEERIARLILFREKPDIVLHVISAKDLKRSLPFTLQLKEAGFNIIVVLNIIDEAIHEGLKINVKRLEKILNIPVVATVSVRNRGIAELKDKIVNYKPVGDNTFVKYPNYVEEIITKISSSLQGNYSISKRTVALLFLQDDKDIMGVLKEQEEKATLYSIGLLKEELKKRMSQPLEYVLNITLEEQADRIAKEVIEEIPVKGKRISSFLSRLSLHPLFGIPMLFLFLYYGLYKFVGVFGAGVVVDYLEGFFESYINPFFVAIFEKFLPYPIFNSLFVGEYGILTLGLRYAVAIILPVVGFFFFLFSFAEDTGYLPRIGVMLDRLFKKIGLSGRAVIPLVLGLGCDTMATMVTRILPTKRERIIATVLLSLSIPCSAQLGVIMAVLSEKKWALSIWFICITLTFTIIGFLINKIIPGSQPAFYLELPPLRMPRLGNILLKTTSRLKWYFKEVLPLFIWASVFIWVGKISGIFDYIISILAYPLKIVGLPKIIAKVFLFGFFRRDYGAAGLYDLNSEGLLSARELAVTAVMLTLFLPCIAQFLMNIKERGYKVALGIAGFILVFSFIMGYMLNKILMMIGVN